MKKIISILTLFLGVSFAINAQDGEFKIKYGPEHDSKLFIERFLGEVDGTVIYSCYKRRLGGVDYSIGGINSKTLKVEFETPIEIPKYNGSEVTLFAKRVVDGELLLFFTFYDKKADKNFLFAQQYNARGKKQGNLIKLKEMTAESKRNVGSYSISVDDESDRILIYTNPPYEAYSNEKFGFTVMDKKLNVIWEEELELPYKDKHFSLGDYMIDENDELYMLCSFNENAAIKEEQGRKAAKQDIKEKGFNYKTYKLLNYDPASNALKEFEIDLGKGNSIVSVGYNVDTNGNINISGLYGDQKSKGSGIGVFFGKMDGQTKETISMSLKELDKDFLEEYVGEKNADKGIGVRSLELKQFINRTDGGLVVCGEIHYSYERCTTDSKGVTRCVTIFVHGPIFTINIDPVGDIDWLTVIKKDQRIASIDGYLSSYVAVVGDDGIYYIYNDAMANHNPKKKPKRAAIMNGVVKKTITAVSTVSYDGRTSTAISAELNAKKMLLRPELATTIGTGENERTMLVAIGKKGKQCVVEIIKD
jgi:hypothetical protein